MGIKLGSRLLHSLGEIFGNNEEKTIDINDSLKKKLKEVDSLGKDASSSVVTDNATKRAGFSKRVKPQEQIEPTEGAKEKGDAQKVKDDEYIK